MRRSRRDAREDLSLAVRCLPHHTRLAMLEGVRANDIIVGAYVDRRGGVCPMLAAHRCGGRTDFLALPPARGRFTRAQRAPRAPQREGSLLVSYLPAALLGAGPPRAGHPSQAIPDHP